MDIFQISFNIIALIILYMGIMTTFEIKDYGGVICTIVDKVVYPVAIGVVVIYLICDFLTYISS